MCSSDLAKRDPAWGPVLLMGLGGIWVEALGDVRLVSATATRATILEELQKLRTAKLLNGFRGQPPVIPHSIENVDEITAEENPCLECHITDEFKGKKMPRVPDSHLVPGKTDDIGNPVLNMARFQCNSCHAPQVDARPLVDNQFRGLAPRPAASSSSRTAAK